VPRLAAICGYLFAFTLLSALTWLVWQYRYEPLQDQPALTLGHTPKEVMRVPFGKMESAGEAGAVLFKAAPDWPRIEFRWREQPRGKYAHIRFKATCEGVEAGRYSWDDACITLIWIDATGKMAPDFLSLWSAKGDVQISRDMVVPLARHGTLPKIIITNRGRAGEFTLHSFSMQMVAYRPGIFAAIGLLVAAWLAWGAWGIRRWVVGTAANPLKLTAAAALWVAFGWFSSLPGPWIPWQSIGEPYPIEVVRSPAEAPKVIPTPTPPTVPTPAPKPTAPPANGNPPSNPAPSPLATAPAPVPDPAPAPPPTPPAPQPLPAAQEGAPEGIGGGPIRWLLAHLPAVKKVAHLVGFALLTVLLGLLTGSRRAVWPALALAALSEFCQWAFGFGFGWDDVLDLVLDTGAVLGGIAVWHWFVRCLQKRKARASSTDLQASDIRA
jgi:hypothetical protein